MSKKSKFYQKEDYNNLYENKTSFLKKKKYKNIELEYDYDETPYLKDPKIYRLLKETY